MSFLHVLKILNAIFNLISLYLNAEAERVVGWARNHYLSSCVLPSVKGDRLMVPRER